jgi:hypothetical protein
MIIKKNENFFILSVSRSLRNNMNSGSNFLFNTIFAQLSFGFTYFYSRNASNIDLHHKIYIILLLSFILIKFYNPSFDFKLFETKKN